MSSRPSTGGGGLMGERRQAEPYVCGVDADMMDGYATEGHKSQ